MFILFFSYSTLQYIIIEHKTLEYEKQNINRQMQEMLVLIESYPHLLTLEEIKKWKMTFQE
jgi:two-component system, OmpR family, sensor histidine kinase ArlS